MEGDGKGMVVLQLGYNELIVQVKAATVFMDIIASGGAYKFDSKWLGQGNGSLEVIEPVDILIKHLPTERVALAKLNREAYKQYQEEKERKEKQP